MNTLLLDLTLRGTLVTLVVLGLDWALTRHMRPAWRRVWWMLVPLAWLVPLRLPSIELLPHLPVPDVSELWSVNKPEAAPAPVDSVSKRAMPAPPIFEWPDVPVAIATAGAAVFLGVVLWRTVRTARRWSQERFSTDPELLGLLEDCKAVAGITAPIGLVVTESVSTPALLGWLRPRVLLPRSLLNEIPPDQLRSILLHELAHFRSIDIPLNWLFSAAVALHWFNPIVHLAAWRWRHFCELAADASVLRWMPEDAKTAYGEALLRTLRHAHALPVPRGALALGESLVHMKERFALVGRSAPRARQAWLGGLVAFALVAFVVIPSNALNSPSAHIESAKADARRAAESWLAINDTGNFEETWKHMAPESQVLLSREGWIKANNIALEGVGHCLSRTLVSADYQTELRSPNGRVHEGRFVLLQYDSVFDKVSTTREVVTFVQGQDRQWRAAGYYVTLR